MTPIESSKQKFPGGFTVIGTGRLGSALALRLHQKGFRLHSLYNRSLASCEALAKQTGTGTWGTYPEKRSDLGDLVFLALPDDQISGFAENAANLFRSDDTASRFQSDDATSLSRDDDMASFSRGQDGPAWIHTSGATPAEALQPLAQTGAQIASFHPVQTFNRQNRDTAFDQCFITLQGDEELCKDLKQIVRVIGGRPLIVDVRQKTAIHLAAVFLCNYYIALFSGSQDILDNSGIEVRSRELFGPIVRQTIEALLHHPPEEVLTGPIVRGDISSVDRHLEQLQTLPAWDRLYRELGKATLAVARNIPQRDSSSDDQLEMKFQT